jgi:hypothetical protein
MAIKMQQLPIVDATDQQIRDFCDAQQIELDATSRSEMLAVLSSVWEHDYILMAVGEYDGQTDQVQTPEPIAQTTITGGVGSNDPKVLIRIGKTEMPGGKDPVPVGVNGRTVVIQRDMNVELPYRFYLALQNAVRETVDQNSQTGDITTSAVSNYPMQTLRLPPQDEIDAWHESTRDVLMPA